MYFDIEWNPMIEHLIQGILQQLNWKICVMSSKCKTNCERIMKIEIDILNCKKVQAH